MLFHESSCLVQYLPMFLIVHSYIESYIDKCTCTASMRAEHIHALSGRTRTRHRGECVQLKRLIDSFPHKMCKVFRFSIRFCDGDETSIFIFVINLHILKSSFYYPCLRKQNYIYNASSSTICLLTGSLRDALFMQHQDSYHYALPSTISISALSMASLVSPKTDVHCRWKE